MPMTDQNGVKALQIIRTTREVNPSTSADRYNTELNILDHYYQWK